MTRLVLASLAGLLLVGVAVSARSQFAGESVSLRAPSDNDVYAAAQYLELLAPVDGDAVLAGQSVVVAGPVANDVIAAGETVSVRAPVGDDVRMAAREASLQADVGGHVVAAGQSVTIDPGVSVRDWAWLAGERIVMHGSIGGELRAAGATIRIGGNIGGNAELVGDDIRIESGAVIGGDVTVRSEREPTIDEDAQIGGQVIQVPSPVQKPEDEDWQVTGRLFFGFAVILTLLIYYWLFPQFAQRVAITLAAEPFKSLGLGAGAVLVTPLVIVVLFATGVGFLLALPLGAVYFMLLLSGYLAGLYTIAELVARGTGHAASARGARSLILALTVVAAALITLIPVLGSLAVFVLWLLGIGALVTVLHRMYTGAVDQPS